MAASKSEPGSDRAIIAALISLVLPGLGLLISKEKRMIGILIFVCAMIANGVFAVIGSIGLMCVVGAIFYVGIPVVHVLACVHTYDTIKKEEGGEPILFK